VLESHQEDRGLSGARKAILPRRCRREEARGIERWSTRIFGEYAFLEDSRYASQAKNERGKNSHTVARVSGGQLVKSATERRSPDAAATRALRGLRYWDEHERRLCPMREPGDIGAVVDA